MDTLLHQALHAAAFRDAHRNPPRPRAAAIRDAVDAPAPLAKRSRFARVAHPFHRGSVAQSF